MITIRNILLLLTVPLLFAGCGGGESSAELKGSGAPLLLATRGTEADLGPESTDFRSAKSVSVYKKELITVDQLFNWAEFKFPELFPSNQTTKILPPYQYRYYPETDLYVGVAGGEVFLLGTTQTGGSIVSVGFVANYTAEVIASGFSGDKQTDTSPNGYPTAAQITTANNSSASVISAVVLFFIQ